MCTKKRKNDFLMSKTYLFFIPLLILISCSVDIKNNNSKDVEKILLKQDTTQIVPVIDTILDSRHITVFRTTDSTVAFVVERNGVIHKLESTLPVDGTLTDWNRIINCDSKRKCKTEYLVEYDDSTLLFSFSDFKGRAILTGLVTGVVPVLLGGDHSTHNFISNEMGMVYVNKEKRVILTHGSAFYHDDSPKSERHVRLYKIKKNKFHFIQKSITIKSDAGEFYGLHTDSDYMDFYTYALNKYKI